MTTELDLVPSLETCQALWKAGFRQETYFAWQVDFFDSWRPVLSTIDINGINNFPAPTAFELLKLLPPTFGISSNALTLHVNEKSNYDAGYYDADWMKRHDQNCEHPSNPAEALALLLLNLIQNNHVKL